MGQGIASAIIVTHSYMATKNPAPTPSTNSAYRVSGMIDPRSAPAPGLSASQLGQLRGSTPGVLPLRLLEPYLRLTTLEVPVPSKRLIFLTPCPPASDRGPRPPAVGPT
jgi:hypothetical protein